jgi:hypothetical protein
LRAATRERGTFLTVDTAKVRITVNAHGAFIVREGHGTCEGRGNTPGEVHDAALKAAETDATKRALATFGTLFGLTLYANGKANSFAKHSSAGTTGDLGPRVALPPDDTTPIPRLSRYYGRREFAAMRERDHRKPDTQSAAQARQPNAANAYREPRKNNTAY